jgi:hypothetical protein
MASTVWVQIGQYTALFTSLPGAAFFSMVMVGISVSSDGY